MTKAYTAKFLKMDNGYLSTWKIYICIYNLKAKTKEDNDQKGY
jgi:hypothetical protein